jgi:hypothetical protein
MNEFANHHSLSSFFALLVSHIFSAIGANTERQENRGATEMQPRQQQKTYFKVVLLWLREYWIN